MCGWSLGASSRFDSVPQEARGLRGLAGHGFNDVKVKIYISSDPDLTSEYSGTHLKTCSPLFDEVFKINFQGQVQTMILSPLRPCCHPSLPSPPLASSPSSTPSLPPPPHLSAPPPPQLPTSPPFLLTFFPAFSHQKPSSFFESYLVIEVLHDRGILPAKLVGLLQLG